VASKWTTTPDRRSWRRGNISDKPTPLRQFPNPKINTKSNPSREEIAKKGGKFYKILGRC
jgi:hypothetical protein